MPMTAYAPVQHDGMAPLANQYDGFILDLWGVIHDGVTAYPGAAECLAALQRANRAVVLLTNAPRPAEVVATLMEGMGIPRDLYNGILTSGDAVNQELRTRADPAFASLGKRALLIGPERDYGTLAGLDMERVSEPEDADWMLITGPTDLSHGLSEYEDLLARCAARGLPAICGNPDQYVIREGKKIICAGLLADHYRGLGGSVTDRGKPDPSIYRMAIGRLGLSETAKVAVVGDGLHTDMPGAKAAGLDGIFVTGGLNAEPLGIRHGEPADKGRLVEYLQPTGLTPVAAIPAFIW